MLKSLSETRWSAKADVLRAQITSRYEMKKALEDLIEDNTQIPDMQVTAEGFRKTLESFQTTLFTVIWDEILQRVDKTSEILQREELDLLCATKVLQTLSLFLSEKRSNFDDYEARALQLANVPEPNYEKKSEKGNFFQMNKTDPDFKRMSPSERFRAGVFLPFIDNLVAQLNKRRDCYEVLNTRFEIFSNLEEKEKEEVTKQAKYLAQSYPKDIDEELFVQECHHFKMYMKVET
ncbi:dimer_Tnp_hAT domain-containing protein [Trichonephila clavata]|uniref:Dimer_Tnp_hAT domain-containing protein n=1 Tax=Trichonephila clavata TaxID=2740835 RepID=A0A8X6LTF0_TRICU|nr:dimer_Tnp_hAT domain-containing protein [Trichonephila clavata]